MRLLITGAGRCGTWWLTHALRSTGVAAEHEHAFNHYDHGEDQWVCEVSWLAAPFTPILDAHVVHLVRDPRQQIASRAAWGSFEPDPPPSGYDPRPKGSWAAAVCPRIRDGSTPVERAAIHWHDWNMLVRADELLRLEDVTAKTVHRLARIVDPDARHPVLPEPTNRARRPVPTLGWSDLPVDVIELAATYGYREDPCAS